MKSKKITQSARGEQCLINIAGVCSYDAETTVFCHFPDVSHGTSLKATDFSGGYGCYNCHQVIDGHGGKCQEFDDHKDFYYRRAQTRTLGRLLDKGIINIG